MADQPQKADAVRDRLEQWLAEHPAEAERFRAGDLLAVPSTIAGLFGHEPIITIHG